jgi:hypothetical protein
MTPTVARDRASALATSDIEAALQAAREVADPWFACQALAWVGRFAPEDRVVAILDEAIAVGGRAADPFRAVACIAWPLRALVERNHAHRLGPALLALLRQVPSIEHPASRSEALFLIFQAVYPAGRRWWFPVLVELRDASHPAVHWRQARSIRDAVLIAASEDADFARDFCPGVRNDRARSQIERALARSERRSPRPFFWRGDA